MRDEFFGGMNEFGSMSARRNSSKIRSCERKVRYGVRCTSLLLNRKRARIHGFDSHCLITTIHLRFLTISGGDMNFAGGVITNRVYESYPEFLAIPSSYIYVRHPLFVLLLSLLSRCFLLRCRNHSTRKLILVKESSQKRVA